MLTFRMNLDLRKRRLPNYLHIFKFTSSSNNAPQLWGAGSHTFLIFEFPMTYALRRFIVAIKAIIIIIKCPGGVHLKPKSYFVT